MKIIHVVGARPNFMKTAPIMREMAAEDGRRTSRARHPQEFEQLLVHTGQHYGNGTLLHNMSKASFSRTWSCPNPTSTWGWALAATRSIWPG